MIEYADLEIGLYRQDADTYAVELRFRQPEDQADPSPERCEAAFDLKALNSLRQQLDEYGLELSKRLFADLRVLKTFEKACAAGATGEKALRVRLYIDRSAPELHNVYWESLRNPCVDTWPNDGPLLATNQNILLSRYGRSSDWRPVRLRPKGDLRALVFIANPSDLKDYDNSQMVGQRRLAPVDVQGELDRARKALRPIQPDEVFSDPVSPGRASLNELIARLDRGYDIIYLVSHGALVRKDPQSKQEPYLWLEKEDGHSDRVLGTQLVDRLRDTLDRPRLVVLASCQSAGDGGLRSSDEGALAALGPLLAEDAGIPAVLAMQGSVTMDTVATFMPVFFTALCDHGQIDQAMAKARDAVRDRTDWWMPTLMMRLRLGQIWYQPQFSQEEFTTWNDLVASAIKPGRATPILGPGLIELLGSPQEIAARWAEDEHFPMAPHQRRDLPQVAQYLATMQSAVFPTTKLLDYLTREMWRRHKDKLQGEPANADLDRLVSLVGEKGRQADEAEPYRVLAQLPVAIYINANPGNLLFDALKEAGKDPQVALCPWNKSITQPDSAYAKDPDYVPSKKQPLVYHLFGRLNQPDSLVLSEDDYFNYLIWASVEQSRGEHSAIPSSVTKALSTNALMFLGFQIDDWNFRVLLHSIINPEAGIPAKRPKSVAVQISPEEGPFLNAKGARKYLQSYFAEFRNVKMNMFWGTAHDFVRELWQRRQQWM